jgi:hypothetical protein
MFARVFGRHVPELAWAILAEPRRAAWPHGPIRSLVDARVAIANAVQRVAPWHARPRAVPPLSWRRSVWARLAQVGMVRAQRRSAASTTAALARCHLEQWIEDRWPFDLRLRSPTRREPPLSWPQIVQRTR